MGCVLATARRAAALSLELVALVLALTLLLPAVLGYSRYVITGGSMSGTYDRGSLLFTRDVPVGELGVGEVITYVPPGKDELVTHRIVEVSLSKRGVPVFRTRGDANEKADPWTFKLDEPVQARAEFALPYLGYPIAALSIRELRMALIGLPALLIAAALIARMWHESGRPQAGPGRPQASPTR